MDLFRLNQFYHVAKEGSLTKAAGKLNISISALCRSVQYFEYSLRMTLFERVPQGMLLTHQGERLYDYAKKLIEEAQLFERALRENEDELRGDLRIITFPFVGAEFLVPNLKGFYEKYPEVSIKICIESENINPYEADVILSAYLPHQPHLIQKELFPMHTQLFASEAYLNKYGIPKKPEDFDRHRLITYRGNAPSHLRSITSLLNIGKSANDLPRKSDLEVSSLHGMLNAALEGYGIVELPNYKKVVESGLKVVLPEIRGESTPLYYIFSENRKRSKKINKFYEYLTKNSK